MKWDVSCLAAGGVAGRLGRSTGVASVGGGGRGRLMHRASCGAGGTGAGGLELEEDWGSSSGARTGNSGGGGARTGGPSGTLFNKGTR